MATEYYDAGGENFASATDVDDSAYEFYKLNLQLIAERVY